MGSERLEGRGGPGAAGTGIVNGWKKEKLRVWVKI